MAGSARGYNRYVHRSVNFACFSADVHGDLCNSVLRQAHAMSARERDEIYGGSVLLVAGKRTRVVNRSLRALGGLNVSWRVVLPASTPFLQHWKRGT